MVLYVFIIRDNKFFSVRESKFQFEVNDLRKRREIKTLVILCYFSTFKCPVHVIYDRSTLGLLKYHFGSLYRHRREQLLLRRSTHAICLLSHQKMSPKDMASLNKSPARFQLNLLLIFVYNT